MTELTPAEVEQAWQRAEATAFEATYAAHQECFEIFGLLQRESVRLDLQDEIPALEEQKFGDVNAILLVHSLGAMRQGARIFASLVPPRHDPTQAQEIDFSTIAKAADDTAQSDAHWHFALRDRIAQLPMLDQLLSIAGEGLMVRLLMRFDILEPHATLVRRTLLTSLFHGVRIEFLLGRYLSSNDPTTLPPPQGPSA